MLITFLWGINMAKRILISDDALFMRSMLRDILTDAGYEVCGEAANGEESLNLYKELKPDLVTMDVVMPKMNGIETVKAIIDYDPKAKILMCTGMGHQAMVTEALMSGAKDFVVKPFHPSRVLEALNKIL